MVVVMMKGASNRQRGTAQRPRLTGRIVRITENGYGFIRPDGDAVEHYVNIVDLDDRSKWRRGARVEFTSAQVEGKRNTDKPRAPRALNVTVVPE